MVTSRTGTAKWKALRARLIRERDHACHHCGRALDEQAPRNTASAVEVDHLTPVAVRPDLEFDADNCVLACHGCNRSKGDRLTQSMPYEFDRNGVRWALGFNIKKCRAHGTEVLASCPHSGALL